MKRTTIGLFLLCITMTFAQVGIGTTTPNISAELELLSTNRGLLIPRMTQAQKTGIGTPAEGLLIYQTDAANGFWYYDGAAWTQIGGTAAAGWLISGNAGTNPTTNYIGTSDAQDFVVRTNNTESFRITPDQNIGIGVTTPTAIVEIVGTSPAFRYDSGQQVNGYVLTSDNDGNAFWSDPGSISISADDDWLLTPWTAGTTNADAVYHLGQVVIGKNTFATPSTVEIDIDNGAATGTTIGIGDGEFEDGLNVTFFNQNLIPNVSAAQNLGYANTVTTLNHRWNNTYGVAATINTSDGRLKKNVQNLSYGIDEIMQLKPISYNWKQEINGFHDKTTPKETKLGFRAQELEAVIPEAVISEVNFRTDEEGTMEKKQMKYRGVNYESLIPVLVKAQQDQQKEIEELLQKNAELKAKLKNKKQ